MSVTVKPVFFTFPFYFVNFATLVTAKITGHECPRSRAIFSVLLSSPGKKRQNRRHQNNSIDQTAKMGFYRTLIKFMLCVDVQSSPTLQVCGYRLEGLWFMSSAVSATLFQRQVAVFHAAYTEPVCTVCERQLRKHQGKPTRNEACRSDVCYHDEVPAVKV